MKGIDIVLTGILSVIGLSENPFSARVSKIRSRTAEQSLAGDFSIIASDFRKVFEEKKVEANKRY